MKLNVLAFGAHPDDAELSCSGTLISQIRKGNTAGIIDLTRGELGSRGTAEIRDQEGEDARKIIGASIRENLNLEDGFFRNDRETQMKAITVIRKFQPEYILCNATDDRHPDHGRAAKLIEDAVFLAGLIKIETTENGTPQNLWRPKMVLHYIQDRYINPDIVIDISDVWEQRMESIKAHRSQFYDPNSNEPETYVASKIFFEMIESRAREMGRSSGFKFAEGYTCGRMFGIKDLTQLY